MRNGGVARLVSANKRQVFLSGIIYRRSALPFGLGGSSTYYGGPPRGRKRLRAVGRLPAAPDVDGARLISMREPVTFGTFVPAITVLAVIAAAVPLLNGTAAPAVNETGTSTATGVVLDALPAPCNVKLFEAGHCDREVLADRVIVQLLLVQDAMIAEGQGDSIEYDGVTKLMLTLGQEPEEEQSGECTEYLASEGCWWTNKWACPSSSAAGTQGYASDDASLGFRCCCPPDAITPEEQFTLYKACLGEQGNTNVASTAIVLARKLMQVRYLSGRATSFLNSFGLAMIKYSVGHVEESDVLESAVLSTSLTSKMLAKRLSDSLRNDKGRLYQRYVRSAHRVIRKARNSHALEVLQRVMQGLGFQKALQAAARRAPSKVPVPADMIRSGKELIGLASGA